MDCIFQIHSTFASWQKTNQMVDSILSTFLLIVLSIFLVSASNEQNDTLSFGTSVDIDCGEEQILDCNWLHYNRSVEVGRKRYKYSCSTGNDTKYCAVYPVQLYEVHGDEHWHCWCITNNVSPELENETQSLTTECGHANDLHIAEAKIAGGETTSSNKYPWIVGIHNRSKDLRYPLYVSLFCHGSLISKKWVVTTAHCVYLNKTLGTVRPLDQLFVSLGGHFLGESLFESNIICKDLCGILIHPKNKRFTFDYDVAMLKLSTEVSFSKEVSPICLPPPHINVTGQMVTVAGWGETRKTFKSLYLNEITIPVISNLDCEHLLNLKSVNITPRMLCAGQLDGYKDTCRGDSGSGLFYKNANNRFVLVGIVSFGLPGCAQPNSPGVYARVSEFLPFINAHPDNESCPAVQ